MIIPFRVPTQSSEKMIRALFPGIDKSPRSLATVIPIVMSTPGASAIVDEHLSVSAVLLCIVAP